MSRVLRIIHEDSTEPRAIEEQAFIAEVEALQREDSPPEALRPGVRLPLPCTVESLDGLGRLRWRAYCSTREGLLDLARELGQERSMVAGKRPPS